MLIDIMKMLYQIKFSRINFMLWAIVLVINSLAILLTLNLFNPSRKYVQKAVIVIRLDCALFMKFLM